ncbi:MAG: hypothetical protein H7A23_06660 [Leptospiraceae bacterium]|nr:hypothetical protein [Leptospiraceae bacterium]MCP5494221.1 hypothetical protein [Leptospiraceae bacterium]
MSSLFSDKQNIVYFDPDGNLRNIAGIQAEGNKYFQSISSELNFLVIGNRQVIKKEIENLQPPIMLVQFFYYLDNKSSLHLKPHFVFLSEGSITYTKKVITMNQDIQSLKSLDKKIVASSLSKSGFKKLLGNVNQNWRLLTVPKDLDAIMGLKFKQADAAIVSNNSLAAFSKIDPVDTKNIRTLYTTKEIYLPIGVVTKFSKNDKDISKIFLSIKNIKQSKEGKSFLEMLNFNGITDDQSILQKIR